MATMVQPPSVPPLPCLLATQPPLHSLVKPHFSHHVIFPHAPPVIERGLSAALSTQPTPCAITLLPVTRQGLPWPIGLAQPLVGGAAGPSPNQPTGNKQPLVVLFSHWLVPVGPAHKPSTVVERPLVKQFSQRLVEWLSSGVE